MKKIILHSLFCIACFAFITSCSKSLKAPATSKTTATTTKTTGKQTQTQNQNQDQQGHSCGGSSTTHSSGSGY